MTTNKVQIVHSVLTEVWSEIDRENHILLMAYFDNEKLWGIIEIDHNVYGNSPYSSMPGNSQEGKNGDDRELFIVNSRDYRDTITRAQMLWNENIDKWVDK